MAPLLGYWDIRGIGQVIRFMLEYAGVQYEERRYKYNGAQTNPQEDPRQEWLKDKFELGLSFPNLPYYLDDDGAQVRLSQSGAIMRYLGRKYNMEGREEPERQRVDLIEAQLRDDYKQFALMAYNERHDELKVAYLRDTLPEKFKCYSDFLAQKPGQFVSGADYVTYADFFLLEYLEAQEAMFPGLLAKNWPILSGFRDKILALEPIRNYMRSERFLDWPFYLSFAKWGGEPSRQQ